MIGCSSRPLGVLVQLLAATEREAIAAALLEHTGNVSRAAASLGVERTHLHKKMRKHGLTGQGRTLPACVAVEDVHGADGAPGSEL